MLIRSLSVLAFALAAFASLNSFASEMGPVVNTMRWHFSHAHAPRMEELKLGQAWQCTEYYARAEDQVGAMTYNSYFLFSQSQDGASIQNSGSGSGNIFKFTASGLANEGVQNVVRVTEAGDLVAELSTGVMGWSDEFTFPSLVNSNLAVMLYSFCQKL